MTRSLCLRLLPLAIRDLVEHLVSPGIEALDGCSKSLKLDGGLLFELPLLPWKFNGAGTSVPL